VRREGSLQLGNVTAWMRVVIFLHFSQEGICSFGDCETGRRIRSELSFLGGRWSSGGPSEEMRLILCIARGMAEGNQALGNWIEFTRPGYPQYRKKEFSVTKLMCVCVCVCGFWC
jgi:hypothetical protein